MSRLCAGSDFCAELAGAAETCFFRALVSSSEYGVDVEKLSGSLGSETQFYEYVARHGTDSVMNLSWRQFEEFRHRGAVFASPVRNGRNKFVGCVSADASRGFTSLDTDELWSELNSVCLRIGQVGFDDA